MAKKRSEKNIHQRERGEEKFFGILNENERIEAEPKHKRPSIDNQPNNGFFPSLYVLVCERGN